MDVNWIIDKNIPMTLLDILNSSLKVGIKIPLKLKDMETISIEKNNIPIKKYFSFLFIIISSLI